MLEHVEASAEPGGREAHAMLAFIAGRDVAFEPARLQAARRRALLVLAAGGDPRRELDPDSRGVAAFAADLDADERRAELRSALERLRGEAEGLPAVAAARGVAPSTVRSHLQRVFEKTGTRRQAQLARLLALLAG